MYDHLKDKLVKYKDMGITGKVIYLFQRFDALTREWSWIAAVLMDGRTVDWPAEACIVEETIEG